MAIKSSSGFFHLQPGVLHISLWTHKTQHRQPRGWKKREQSWAWVSSKHKKGDCNTFLAFCASVSMYLSKISTKSPGMLTHPFTLANPASEFAHPSSQLPPTSVHCPGLFCWFTPSLDSGNFLPSSSSSLVRNLTCKPFVWVSCQNQQRNLLTGTYPQKWMAPIVSHQYL